MPYADRHKGKLTGRWVGEVDTRQPDGTEVRFKKRFPTRDEAKGFEAYVKATGKIPPHLTETAAGTFADVAARWKAQQVDWFNSHDGSTNAGRFDFALAHLGQIDVAHLRRPELENYVKLIRERCGYAGRPPANRTINCYLSVVSMVLRYAHELELIKSLPAFPRQKSTGKDRDAVPWHIENAVCALLQRQGKDKEAFCVRVLAATGMRSGELHKIEPEQIETPAQIEYTGIGLRKEQTKGKRARWCPILPDAARKLRAMIAAGELPDAAQVYETFKGALRVLGEGTRYTIHSLRHSTNTRLREAGVNPLDVAELLGHKTGSMTQHYYHANKPYLFEVAKKVQHGLGEMPQIGEVVPLKSQEKIA